MAFRFKQVKRLKRGAKWDDGSPRFCTRCGMRSGRKRRKQAKFTALLAHKDSQYVLPVGYCKEHVPEELLDKLR